MTVRAIPDVPYADAALYQFLLTLKQNLEDMQQTVNLPNGGTVNFGTVASVKYNTATNQFEFYKNGTLASTI